MCCKQHVCANLAVSWHRYGRGRYVLLVLLLPPLQAAVAVEVSVAVDESVEESIVYGQ